MNEAIEQKKSIWVAIAALIAIVGIVITIYSISHHIALTSGGSTTDYACNINDTLSCDAVVNTKYSEIMGIPLGTWGLAYFLSLFVLLGMIFFKKEDHETERQTYAAMVVIGVLVSLVYGLISKIIIGALCPSCMAIYTVTVAQAINLAFFRKEIPLPFSLKKLINGGSIAVIICALVAGGYSLIKPTLVEKKMVGDQVVAPTGIPVMNFVPKKVDIKIDKSAYSGLGEDFRKGSDNARVVIHEFSDFQCPGCAQAAKILSNLHERYGNQVLLVFKNAPLDQACNPGVKRRYHDYACRIAVMARCAGQYGKFWQYHDKAFGERNLASNEQAVQWAKDLGLSESEINGCLESKDIIKKIQEDIKQADSIPLEATPTILVNGRKFVGRSYDSISLEIDKILKSPEGEESANLNPLNEIKTLVSEQKAVLVDVREQSEFDAEHLEGALLLPLNNLRGLKKGDKVPTLPENKILYVYCNSGRRAKIAAQVLTALGYNANALPISFEDIVAGGFPKTQSFGPLK